MVASKEPRLFIKYVPISELEALDRNARTHSKRQIRQIANSVDRFGWTNPVIIDRFNRIIAGHGRVDAAKLLGLEEVPAILLENLTEDEIRLYVIADNRLAENAGWDNSILAIEFQHLITLDFDVTISGFEVPEIDQIIEDANGSFSIEDEIPLTEPDQPPVTRLGDLWVLEKHRILCGNSLREESYRLLLARKRASVVVCDSPYNVPIDGHATGNGAIRHREFEMGSGELSRAEFFSFLSKTTELAFRFSTSNAVGYFFMDWRSIDELIRAAMQVYDQYAGLCVWVKDNAGLGSYYRSQHELVGVFRKGKGPHRNNIQLGKFGRNRSNVWRHPGVHTLSRQSEEGNLLAMHPTTKPISLVADAILDSSARGEIVLDPFLGSGTTTLASARVGRACYGIEIDPLYVDVAIRRWQKFTGQAAVHTESGKKFDEIQALRGSKNA